MALGAFAMAPGRARGIGAVQRVAFGRREAGDSRFHFRAPGGLIRGRRGQRAQGSQMREEGGQRRVEWSFHDSGLISTPLSRAISLPIAKPATAAPSAIDRKCAPLKNRPRSASQPSK